MTEDQIFNLLLGIPVKKGGLQNAGLRELRSIVLFGGLLGKRIIAVKVSHI